MKKSVLISLFILVTMSLFSQTSIGWGNMQWPNSISIVQNETTENIYGQVWMDGVTTPAGQGAGITAECGYGADGSTPDASWTWFGATYFQDVGSNDEYIYNIVCSMAAGDYDYTYRYQYTGDPDYYYAGNVGDLTVNAAPPPTYNVTFQVDMENQTVDPLGVFISGSFNGWGTTAMTAPARAEIYTVTLVLESAYYEYKYVNGASYETIDNRTITTPGTDHIAPVVFFDDFAGGTTQTVDVTFSVNMGLLDPGWYAGGVSVQGSVTPLDWTEGSNLLTDPDEDLIYTGTLTFPVGSAYDVDYKFTRDDGAARTWWWETTPNRPFVIDDSGATQTLDINFWEDDEPLAVNLSSFYALYIGERPSIYWVTQSEEDNEYWNIYRASSDNFTEALHLNASNPIPGNGTTNSASDYVYVDTTPVVQNTTYWYWIEDVAIDGESEVHEPISLSIPGETPNTPVKYGLHQNYPNPFNPSTSISFTLEEDSDVEILIFNVKGEQIKKYEIPSHQNSIVWDGTDHKGYQVSSGVYFYKLVTDTKEYQKKMLLVK